MMRYFAFALPALLIVGACSQQDDEPADAQQTSADDAAGADIGADMGAGALESDGAAANTIPAGFRGVWDHMEGSCGLESDARIEISAGEVLFYESVGVVTASVRDGKDLVVTLAMEGEGENWVQAYRLSLSQGGQVLNSQAIGEDFEDGPLPRKRCPDAADGSATR